MSDHTPALDDLRAGFLDMYADEALGRAEFDRAIEKVRAEAKAEALREAADNLPSQSKERMSMGYWLRARADKLVTE